ncbi:MAG: glycosyltransferase family 4 protein [Gilvibacter sp.]
MKKILHISNTDKSIFNFRMHLLMALQQKGYEVHICAAPLAPKFEQSFKEQGFVFHPVDIKRGLNPLNAFKSIKRVRKVIRSQDFEIIHTHTPTGGMIGRMAARLEKHPKVFHTTAGLYFHENMSALKYKFFSGIERYLTAKTQVLFSPNYDDMETCKALNIKPIHTLAYCGPAGVYLDRFPTDKKAALTAQFKQQNGLEEDTMLVALVARMEREKGYIEFLDVVKKLKDNGKKIVGVSIGEGRDSEIIKEHARTHNIENVLFLGYQSGVPDLMQAFDVLLFPSYREGLPIVTLEAMAAQVPVVAYNIRGCRESIVHDKTGFLVTFGDTNALFESTNKLLEDDSLRTLMGKDGRARVAQHFTREMHTKRQLPYYEHFDQ